MIRPIRELSISSTSTEPMRRLQYFIFHGFLQPFNKNSASPVPRHPCIRIRHHLSCTGPAGTAKWRQGFLLNQEVYATCGKDECAARDTGIEVTLKGGASRGCVLSVFQALVDAWFSIPGPLGNERVRFPEPLIANHDRTRILLCFFLKPCCH